MRCDLSFPKRTLVRCFGAPMRLGRYGGINEDFVLVGGWGECKADGSQEMVEGVGKVLVKAVEQRALRVGEDLVSGDRVKESSGERSVDAMEEFQENQAYRISFGRQTVAAGGGGRLAQGLWGGNWEGGVE